MKKLIIFLFLYVLLAFSATTSNAQCAMCRRNAETNYKQDKELGSTATKGKSLNNGILYLLSVPYLLGAVGAIALYKNRKKF